MNDVQYKVMKPSQMVALIRNTMTYFGEEWGYRGGGANLVNECKFEPFRISPIELSDAAIQRRVKDMGGDYTFAQVTYEQIKADLTEVGVFTMPFDGGERIIGLTDPMEHGVGKLHVWVPAPKFTGQKKLTDVMTGVMGMMAKQCNEKLIEMNKSADPKTIIADIYKLL